MNLAYIRWKAQWCGVECPLSCTLAQVICSKKVAVDEYEWLKPNAPKLWKEHLWDQANDHSLDSDPNMQKQAKCLLWEEIQHEAIHHLCRALEMTSSCVVDWIEIEEDSTLVWKEDQASVERGIMETNLTRF